MLENSLAKPLEKLPRKEDITVQCYEKSTIFDGQQKEKYQQLFEGLSLNLRPAQKMDSLLYFNWANDPSVRIHSFSSEEIKLKDHQTWFDNKLTSADTYLFVVHQNLEPIGQIRLEIIDNNALISYSIAAQYRGKGYSKFVLQLGINKIKEVKKDIKEVYGFVKISNIASCKVFKRLNFKEQQTDLYPKSLKFTKNVI
nr:GNAT family protein [Portibacter lacus]